MPAENSEEFIDLFGLLSHLWSKKLLVLFCGALGVVGAVLYAIFRPPVYEAQAVISSNAPKSAFSEFAGGVFPSSGGGAALLEVRLRTRSISEKVAELEPEVATVLFEDRWDERKKAWKNGQAPSVIAIGSRLRFKHLDVAANTRAGIVQIKVSLPDSAYAKKVADAYLRALKWSIQQKIRQELEESNDFLQQQAASASDPQIFSRLQSVIAKNVERAFLNNPADFQVVEYPSYPTGKSGAGVAKLVAVWAFFAIVGAVLLFVAQYILLAIIAERRAKRTLK